ncbi:hypothetical protein AB4Y45_33915 [Paraburkholderia sp. EG287A]|uniref:hypothetical protein n=1 Tax=Paraburkholderia sp. EG287A TaxID=3237012 RepID=UPI0034D1FFE7
MSRKATIQKSVPKAIPLLLSKLAAGDVSTGPNALLLRAYIALDALHRGKGTKGLFITFGQQLVIAERLCVAGYEKDQLRALREAHAALVRVDWDARPSNEWKAAGEDYEALRVALQVYEAQLRVVPRSEVRIAQMAMMAMIGRKAAPEPQAAST